MVASVEKPTAPGGPALRLRMLGPLAVSKEGVDLALPQSRKVRALIAYLALAAHALTRARLCELLWDLPNDPRAELRWCLSKARALLDEPGRCRVESSLDTVRLDLADCFVDVIEVERAMQAGIERQGADRLRELARLFEGDFLDGLEVERSPHFSSWLIAQRRRMRACHAAVLEHWVACLEAASDERLDCLEKWLQLAPLDRRAHELLLQALRQRGRMHEGEEHLAAATRAFEAEGLDWRALRSAWRDIRSAEPHPRPPPATGALVFGDAVETLAPGAASEAPSGEPAKPAAAARRASLAVMPFVDRAAPGEARATLCDGLAHDIITRLSKLRSLFVIAQGTVFALHERSVGAEQAGRTLDVDYVVGGSLRRRGARLTAEVELIETRTARIVWAHTFDYPLDDAFLALDEIGNRIVASLASEIELVERNRAILRPPNSLDAWEAHHRGLWHMYRFNRADNERARHYFQMAVRLDPTFSRAHAGLSFTHWQCAFQRWEERGPAIDRAFAAAGQSLISDDRDPAAHWAMGRALWLRGRQDQALAELESSVELSPNFALGHYALAFVRSQSGDPEAAIVSADRSRHLSPFDPLLFGMLGSRAMALARLGRFDDAADWACKAAARPNAHVHIQAIAAHCLALAGRLDEARGFVAAIRQTQPQYGVDDFLGAFCFAAEAEPLFRQAARRIGLS